MDGVTLALCVGEGNPEEKEVEFPAYTERWELRIRIS